MRPRPRDQMAGSIKHDIQRNLTARETAKPFAGRLQIIRNAMKKPSTSTAAPIATHNPRCFSILMRIHSP